MKKIIFLVTLLISLAACNVDVAPDMQDSSYTTRSFEVFVGVLDGVDTHFQYGANYYTCNPADNLVYDVTSGAAVLNTDSTQVACVTDLITRTDIAETTTPLYGG